MPDKPKTQHRSVRIDDELWEQTEAAASAIGLDRATVIRDLLRWWLRQPGAKHPPRPAANTE